MPQRITNISVVVYRNGKRQLLKPNTKFDFTAEEVSQITGSFKNALRKPNSEADSVIDLTNGEVHKNAIRSGGEGSGEGGEGDNKEIVDTTTPKGLTAAQKKDQAKTSDKKKAAEENASTDGTEGL